MKDRSASNTIKGYFYQFDYSILKVLELNDDNAFITVEGIEDVDIHEVENSIAVQCKYYANTEYNHSEIAQPIRYMLNDFYERSTNKKQIINYKLYGFYRCGQGKLPQVIDLDFLKKHFLTYKKDKKVIRLHEDLCLKDSELQEFLSHLSIQIDAKEYAQQLDDIFKRLQFQFECSLFEAEHYYYNNALKVIKELAVRTRIADRRICKKDFIQQVDKKQILFNLWFNLFHGQKEVFKMLRKEYFTNLNVLPFERFFLLEIDKDNYSRTELKELLFIISLKWSKLSKRTPKPFCPYVYIHNIEENELIVLKTELRQEGIKFIDGVEFNGASFNPKAIAECANFNNQIQLKFIDRLGYMNLTLNEILNTKEVYQFFRNDPYFELDNPNIKHVKIQNPELKNIKEVI